MIKTRSLYSHSLRCSAITAAKLLLFAALATGLFTGMSFAQTFPNFSSPTEDSLIQTPCKPVVAQASNNGLFYMAATANDGTYDMNLYYGDYPFSFAPFQTLTSQNTVNKSTCSPAIAAFNNLVYVAYQDTNKNLEVWSLADTPGEAPYATQVASISGLNITTVSGMAVFNGVLYIVYGSGSTNALSATETSDGINFSSHYNFANVSSGAAPALAVFNGVFYMTFQQNSSQNYMWISRSSDGVNWKGEQYTQVSFGGAPTMTVWDNELIIAFQQNNSQRHLFVTVSTDGNSFTSQEYTSTALGSPATLVNTGTFYGLYLYYKQNNSDNNLFYNSEIQ